MKSPLQHKIVFIFFIITIANASFLESLPELRIIGGNETSTKFHPYQVGFFINGTFVIFGGVLIEPNRVLTIASYIKSEAESHPLITVVAGIDNLDSPGPEIQERNVSEIKTHPKYKDGKFENDIAILELTQNFTINDYVDTIPLRESKITENTSCVAIGFGRDSEYTQNSSIGDFEPKLRYVNITVMDAETCRKLHVTKFKSIICGGGDNKSTCIGDEGGALICDGNLTGIVMESEVDPLACRLDRMSTFIELYDYAEWIKYGNVGAASIASICIILLFLVISLFC